MFWVEPGSMGVIEAPFSILLFLLKAVSVEYDGRRNWHQVKVKLRPKFDGQH